MRASRVGICAATLWAACGGDAGIKAYNAAPSASVSSHVDGDQVVEGAEIPLRGQVSDPDDDAEELVVTWVVDGEVECEAAAESSGLTSCPFTFGPGARGEVLMTVLDPHGAAASATVTLDVVAGAPPVVDLVEPVDGAALYAGTTVALRGEVSDAEDPVDLLEVWWASDVQGELPVAGSVGADGVVTGAVSLAEGVHFLTLHARDTTAREASDGVTVVVGAPNSAPTCAITAPASGAVVPFGDLLVLEAEADDVDVGPAALTVAWTSSLDGALGGTPPDSGGRADLATSALSVGSHLVELEVADEVGLTCTDAIVLEVVSAPTVAITAPPSGDVVAQGQSVTLVGEVADVEDAPGALDVLWASSLDGDLSRAAADADGVTTFATAGLSYGTHTITLTATDADGLVGTDTTVLVVNGLPTAGAPSSSHVHV